MCIIPNEFGCAILWFHPFHHFHHLNRKQIGRCVPICLSTHPYPWLCSPQIMPLGLETDEVENPADVPEIDPNGWFWLSVSESIAGRAIMALVSVFALVSVLCVCCVCSCVCVFVFGRRRSSIMIRLLNVRSMGSKWNEQDWLNLCWL